MPSDLVQRLRRFAGLPPQENNASLWAMEAATEIEQLREGKDMIQQTLAEELHFIHQHIEAIEQHLDRLTANSEAWSEAQQRDIAKYAIEPTVRDFLFGFEARLNTIELRTDGINEELRALHAVMRQLLKTFDHMTDVIEQANGG